MAAPLTLTTLNFSGTFVMDKKLSDDPEPILNLQGVDLLRRKAIGLGTVTLTITHGKNGAGVETIDVHQTMTGGIAGQTQNRILDYTERVHTDNLFGQVVGKCRRITVEPLVDEYLKKGWLPDTLEHGVVETIAESDTPKTGKNWIVNQVWGFEEIGTERRYTRRIFARNKDGKPEDAIRARIVYRHVS